MKHLSFGLLVFYLILGLSSAASAQNNPIPNPGFEEWGPNGPIDWTMFDGSGRSTDAHSGLYSLGGEVFDSLLPYSGGGEANFHLNYTPSFFQGYYKIVSVQNDFIDNEVWIRSKETLIGTAVVIDSITSTGWVHFNVPISYTSDKIPDSAEVHLFGMLNTQSNGSFLTNHYGSSFVIDDLSLTSPSGVNTLKNISAPFVSNYPNPATESTIFTYDVPEDGLVTIELFNQLGKKLSSSKIFFAKGRQTMPIEVNLLPSGVYLYRVSIAGYSSFGQLEVIR